MARVALLIDEMFEDSEFRVPYDRLRRAGHEVVLVGVEEGKRLVGKRGKERIRIEQSIDDVDERDVDAILIPGGYSPDRLRMNEGMVELTRAAFMAGKPVAAVCHGPWMLAEADVLNGRTVTSWPSIRTDLMNAGAKWTDREVVEDGNLITSRKPEDLEAFSAALLRQLGRGVASARSHDMPQKKNVQKANRAKTRKSAMHAFELGQNEPPSRTPARTRGRAVSRTLRRQPRGAAAQNKVAGQAKSSTRGR